MNKENREFLTTKEFTHHSGLSLRTIRNRVKAGRLNPEKKGNKLLFHYTELETIDSHNDFLRDRGLLHSQEIEDQKREFSNLKPWEQRVLNRWEPIIKGYLESKEDVSRGRLTEFTQEYANRFGVSRQTLQRKVKAYLKEGSYSLIPAWNNGNQGKVIDRELAKFIENTYMTPLGPSIKEIWEKAQETFRNEYIQFPSYQTFVSYINEKWTKSEQLLIRDKESWDRLYSPHVRRDWQQVKLNEIWVSDAKQIDVACVFRDKPIFPWFTAFLDAKSRKFVGWILTPVHDSWAIAQSFVYGVREHGAPTIIYIDRGKPYKSHMIAGIKVKKGKEKKLFEDVEETTIPGIFRDLGTEIFYAAPYNAREKIIEPAFKVFTLRCRNLPGYRGHSVKTRPQKLQQEIKSKKLLSFGALQQEIDKIINDRNARPHSTTGRAPDEYYKDHTAIVPSDNYLAFLLMDRHLVTVRDSSVRIGGMLYREENDLWRLAGEKVEARRDPKDLGKCAILFQGKLFCFAQLETPDHYRGQITLESVKTCHRIRKKINKWRKEVIANEEFIDNPIRMATELDGEERLRDRDIRPPSTNVRSLQMKERLAQSVVKGINEFERKEELLLEEKAVAGRSVFSRIVSAFEHTDNQPDKPRIRLIRDE